MSGPVAVRVAVRARCGSCRATLWWAHAYVGNPPTWLPSYHSEPGADPDGALILRCRCGRAPVRISFARFGHELRDLWEQVRDGRSRKKTRVIDV